MLRPMLRRTRTSSSSRRLARAGGLLVRWIVLGFYLVLASTLDLHHNHGAKGLETCGALDCPHAAADPCPVQLFQQAHGDGWEPSPLPLALSVFPWETAGPGINPTSSHEGLKRPRGPPVLLDLTA